MYGAIHVGFKIYTEGGNNRRKIPNFFYIQFFIQKYRRCCPMLISLKHVEKKLFNLHQTIYVDFIVFFVIFPIFFLRKRAPLFSSVCVQARKYNFNHVFALSSFNYFSIPYFYPFKQFALSYFYSLEFQRFQSQA